MSADIKTAEAMFHDAIKGFLPKREQGLVMGHFRAVLEAAPASSAMAMQAVGVIKHDASVHGWHMSALIPWDKIGEGTTLYILHSQQSPVQASDAGRQR